MYKKDIQKERSRDDNPKIKKKFKKWQQIQCISVHFSVSIWNKQHFMFINFEVNLS